MGGAIYAAAVLGRRDRVGLRLIGLLHVAADGIKSAFKEDLIPPKADRLLHGLAPFIAFFPVLVLLGVVPFGDALCLATEDGSIVGIAATVSGKAFCSEGVVVPLQVLDLDVGILYYFALAGTGVVGAALAGWSSDNKFSLLGGLRAAGQMVSYEVTLGLTVIGALMIYGTLRIDEMVAWQAENAWGIFVQPVAFVLFFTAAVAETKRIPFDLPEGESEIVAGYFTEYSGLKFAMFFFSEYVAIVASSGLMAALFFGGWHVPFLDRDGLNLVLGDLVVARVPLAHGFVVGIGVLAFVTKTVALCWLQLAVRWTLPRFRYDQLMGLGWRRLLPASLGNIAVTAVLLLAIQGASQSVAEGLDAAGDLSELVVGLVGLALVGWLIVYLLRPAVHTSLEVTSSARFTKAAGGTRTARMGA
jgi:NADH-quinone oxidoreductase subunit H